MLLCERDEGMFLVSRWVVLLFSCWLSFVHLSICKQSNPQATQHKKCPHSQALRGYGLGMKLGMTWVWGHCFVSLYRHLEYIVEGTMYMRMKFYVDGSKRKGVVHLDLKKVTKHPVLAINKNVMRGKSKTGSHWCYIGALAASLIHQFCFLSGLHKVGLIWTDQFLQWDTKYKGVNDNFTLTSSAC